MSMKNCKKVESKEEEAAKDEVIVVERDKYIENSNELVELTKTRLMRAFVEAQDPSSKRQKTMDSDIIPDMESKITMKDEAEQVVARVHTNNLKSSTQETEEMRGLRHMRAFVEARDPFSKVVDDLTLRRFLCARDLDVQQASAMFLKYLKWRQSFAPEGSISASEVPNQIEHNKMFLQGTDKRGCPIAVLLGARHFQVKGGLDEFKRYVVYAFDKISARMPQGQEKFTFIGDLEGWGYSNSDMRAYLGALSILQDYYPERLGKMFIVHVPFVFMTVWKIVCPFIDHKTKEKIKFVENKKIKSTLLEEIDESQLPELYGGKQPLVPI